MGHLEELRGGLIKLFLFLVITACLSYPLVDTILLHLTKPVGRLVFIAPHEAFISKIKIALFAGFIFSSPYVLYQIWHFIESGLSKKERKYVIVFGPFSFLLFAAGAAFGYFIIVPIGIKFLLSFATDLMTPMITIGRYISFLAMLTLAFGALFQLPLAALFLTKLGIVTPRFLILKRREAIVIIFITAAVLTPPDIVTQCLMAVPLLVLYEIGIILSKLAYHPK